MNAALTVIGSVAVVLGFATAVIGLLNQRRIRTASTSADDTARKVQEISVNVDGRLSELIERQAQLLGALHESGTPIPARPALAEPDAAEPDAGDQ
jgi:hypothetical protein